MILLEMTLSGGLVILFITAIRALAIDRLPKGTFPVLWGAALLRLLVPLSAPFRFSLFSLAERGTYAVSASAAAAHNLELAAAARRSKVTVQTASGSVSPWTVFWMLGAGLALLFFTAAYIRHLHCFRSTEAVENGFVSSWLASHPLRRIVSVRESGSVAAPLTYGVLRPIILVPAGLDWEDAETLNYVFAHEYTHIRRFDALLRLLLMAALCVHWFNPFVWVMCILAPRDIELSCDEAVVRRFGLESRRGYALALLKMEESRRCFNAFASGFSKSAAEKRIRAIMKLGRTSTRQVVASVLVSVCVLCVFCVAPAGAEEYGALVESPGLIRLSAEETPQIFESRGAYLVRLKEGNFIKLRISGRGNGTFGFFLCCDKTDEIKGQRITFDDGVQELWLEAPADGNYYIQILRDYQCADGSDDYYTYKISYTGYASNGAHLGAGYRREDMFSGWFTHTYTYTVD